MTSLQSLRYLIHSSMSIEFNRFESSSVGHGIVRTLKYTYSRQRPTMEERRDGGTEEQRSVGATEEALLRICKTMWVKVSKNISLWVRYAKR